MLKKPKISIIVPTYNHLNYLKDALKSVQAQSYSNYEIIIVDNHSTDGTEEYVSALQEKNIKYLKILNNGIIAHSRNHGVANATGEYLAFLDADDLWKPSKLAVCVDYMETNKVSALCHGEHWYHEATGRTRDVKYGRAKKQTLKELFMHGNCISTSAVMIKRSIFEQVGGFDQNPDLVTVEDYDMWLKLAQNRVYFSFIEQILGTYRIHPNNTINSVERYSTGLFLVFQTYLKAPELNTHTIRSKIQLRRRYGFIHYDIGRMYHKSGERKTALLHYFKSSLIWPFNWRNIAAALLLILNVHK